MKLHLGSGSKRIPGFTNVDIRMDVSPDILADVRFLDNIHNNIVDEIYFCHGIEHLRYHDVPLALQEWRRILRPGGLLRLSVPDFRAILKLYSQRGLDAQVRAILNGGQEYIHNVHYSVWDKDSMYEILDDNGFGDPRPYNPKSFLPQNYFDYSMLTVDGIAISLNVEADA